MPKRPTDKLEADGATAPSATPPILGSTKSSVDARLGRPVMARGLLGMTRQGEKAYCYSQSADEIIIGFFGDIARYLAVIRKSGPKSGFSPAEISSILTLNGSPTSWKSEKSEGPFPTAGKTSKTAKKSVSPEVPTTYFTLQDKEHPIVGWQPGDKPFVFFLLPAYPDQPHLLLNEWQVARAIG